MTSRDGRPSCCWRNLTSRSCERKFGPALDGKQVIPLHIPDEFQFMQPELIDELATKVAQHVDLSGSFNSLSG